MEPTDIQQKVKNVIARVLKINAADINDGANFVFDLGADSLQSIELVAAFEEEFGIELDEDKALEVQTVADAARFIAGYIQ
jgi:acyl carrier protein